jgi:hypothetical protein
MVTFTFAPEHTHLFDGSGARIPLDNERPL